MIGRVTMALDCGEEKREKKRMIKRELCTEGRKHTEENWGKRREGKRKRVTGREEREKYNGGMKKKKGNTTQRGEYKLLTKEEGRKQNNRYKNTYIGKMIKGVVTEGNSEVKIGGKEGRRKTKDERNEGKEVKKKGRK